MPLLSNYKIYEEIHLQPPSAAYLDRTEAPSSPPDMCSYPTPGRSQPGFYTYTETDTSLRRSPEHTLK